MKKASIRRKNRPTVDRADYFEFQTKVLRKIMKKWIIRSILLLVLNVMQFTFILRLMEII